MTPTRKMRAIGIDLAWSHANPTGVAALEWRRGEDRARLLALAHLVRDDELVEFVREHTRGETVVAIDAPLIVRNSSGSRPADRACQREFGRFEAGAYPANRAILSHYGGGRPRGETLLRRLRALGFALPNRRPRLEIGSRGRRAIEVYPHAALVRLFGLERTLKYKKKRQSWAIARSELARLLAGLRALDAPRLELPLAVWRALAPQESIGRAYKSREDRLDALVAAYVAVLWARGECEELGERAFGAIVVPRTAALRTRAGAAARRRPN